MKDFFDLLTGQAYGMILIATGKMETTKGSWAEIKMQYLVINKVR